MLDLNTRVAELLEFVQRSDYACSDDLSAMVMEWLEEETGVDLTVEQATDIADYVDEWWLSQG